jgi:hypothetical protein
MFIFHFGKVSLKTLIKCSQNSDEEKKLCTQTQSEKINIGIENKLKIDLNQDIQANVCRTKSLMHRTCIQKYGQKHYIIMQPSSLNFSTTIADINVFNFTQNQLKALERAKHDGLDSFVYSGRNYSVNYFDMENIEKMMPDIVLRNEQKLENGLIIKMIEYESNVVNYVSFLDQPSSSNKCIKENVEFKNELCWCDNECGGCYDKLTIVQYINIDMDRPTRSFACDNIPQYRAYDFNSSVQMAHTFQGRDLAGLPATRKFFIYSPPSICLMKTFGNGSYNVKIVFNDKMKQAHSSIFDGTKLTVNLYQIDYKIPSERIIFSTRKFPINPPRQLNDSHSDLVSLENFIEFTGLTYGKYLIELIFEQISKLCSKIDECVVESTIKKNHFECSKCKKRLVVFNLNKEFNGQECVPENVMRYYEIFFLNSYFDLHDKARIYLFLTQRSEP